MVRPTKFFYDENAKFWNRKQLMVNDAIKRGFEFTSAFGDDITLVRHGGHYGHIETKTIFGSNLFPKFSQKIVPTHSNARN